MELRKVSRLQEPEKIRESDYERRLNTEPVEYRSGEGDGMGEIFGYALKWGVEYDMGDFIEVIQRGALDKADMTDVRVLDNHESHLVLGRTKSGTATIGIDNVGMWYSSSLPNSPNGQNIRESLIRKDIDQSSWGFKIRRDESGKRIGDKWEVRNGKQYRTIFDIEIVYDASPVTFPANPDTSAAKRSMAEFFGEKRDDGMDGDMGGEVVIGETMDGKVVPAWEIGWMFDTVHDCTESGNNMIRRLNYLIDAYTYYAQDQTDLSPIFVGLLAQAQTAKAAMIALIDGHLDALKALNSTENRGQKTEEQNTNTEQINNSISDAILLELELKASQNRANKQKYDYEKICN